jgi:hypothetical protein
MHCLLLRDDMGFIMPTALLNAVMYSRQVYPANGFEV